MKFICKITIFIFLFWLSGCSVSENKTDDIIIGVSFVHLSTPYMKGLDRALMDEAEKQHIQVLRCGVESDQIENQIEAINTYIEQKVDAIIINPTDENRLNPVIEKSYNSGIPTIILKTTATTKKYTCAINSNNIEAGELQMKYLAEKLNGSGNIVILQGDDIIDQKDRTKGNLNILGQYPDLKLVAMTKAFWRRNDAYQVVNNLITSNVKIDGICAQNDEMAFGAIDAFEKNRVNTRDVVVVGVDGTRSALTAIKNGTLDATVLQDAEGQGRAAIIATKKALDGINVDKNYSVPFKLITKSNVTDYIN